MDRFVSAPFAFQRLQEAGEIAAKDETIEEQHVSIEESASESSEGDLGITESFENLSIKKSPLLPRKMCTPNKTPPSSRKGRVLPCPSPGFASPPGFASSIPSEGLDDTSFAAGECEEEEDELAFALLDFHHQLGSRA